MNNDLEVAHPLSDSSSTCFLAELELLPLTKAFRMCGCNSMVALASFTVSE